MFSYNWISVGFQKHWSDSAVIWWMGNPINLYRLEAVAFLGSLWWRPAVWIHSSTDWWKDCPGCLWKQPTSLLSYVWKNWHGCSNFDLQSRRRCQRCPERIWTISATFSLSDQMYSHLIRHWFILCLRTQSGMWVKFAA